MNTVRSLWQAAKRDPLLAIAILGIIAGTIFLIVDRTGFVTTVNHAYIRMTRDHEPTLTFAGDSVIGGFRVESESFETFFKIPTGETVHDFAWSPDGDALAVRTDHGIYLVDVTTGTQLSLETNGDTYMYGFTPDNAFVAQKPGLAYHYVGRIKPSYSLTSAAGPMPATWTNDTYREADEVLESHNGKYAVVAADTDPETCYFYYVTDLNVSFHTMCFDLSAVSWRP